MRELDNEEPLYAPSRDQMVRLDLHLPAERDDFAERHPWNIPGIVYVTESDTCGTGRLEAPGLVAFTADYEEFVFRQPRCDAELELATRAAWADPFDGYRFDGLDRWTPSLVAEWVAALDALRAAMTVLSSRAGIHDLPGSTGTAAPGIADLEIAEGARAYLQYLRSAEFKAYLGALVLHLSAA